MSFRVERECASPKEAAEALRETAATLELAAERIAVERVAEEVWRHFDAYGLEPGLVYRLTASGSAWRDQFELCVLVRREAI